MYSKPRILLVFVLLGIGGICWADVPELINYQGRLLDGDIPVNASTQLTCRLYDAATAGTLHYVETQVVEVTEGFYSMKIGLSNAIPGTLMAVLTNAALYLELEIGHTILAPREQLVSTAYALMASTVPSGAIDAGMLAAGAADDADADPTNELNRAVVLSGSILQSTDAGGTLTTDLSSLSVDTNAVRLAGDTMAGPLTNQNSITASRYYSSKNVASGQSAVSLGGVGNTANGESSTVGGGTANTASGIGAVVTGGSNNTAVGASAFIGGGYGNTAGNAVSDRHVVIAGGTSNTVLDHHSAILGGRENKVTQEYSTLAGGYSNLIDNTYSFIGGGRFNWIRARDNVIGGGGFNRIDSGDIFSFIGGGESNRIYNDRCAIGGGRGNVASNIYVTIGGGDMNVARGDSATIPGGWTNYIGSADAAVIGGGRGNKIFSNCDYSTIVGGRGNVITNSADYAFAGGLGTRVTHDGCFLWADHNTLPVLASTAENQFMVRASGGFIFYSANNTTAGARLASGSGSWSSLSDRAAKDNLEPLDGGQVLETLSGLPLYTWNYKDQVVRIRHAGPMAQDFYSAFGLGEDAKHISNIDADGIALAAIQGLYRITREENETLQTQVEKQAVELDTLRTRVEKLETTMQKILSRAAE